MVKEWVIGSERRELADILTSTDGKFTNTIAEAMRDTKLAKIETSRMMAHHLIALEAIVLSHDTHICANCAHQKYETCSVFDIGHSTDILFGCNQFKKEVM